MDYLAPKNNLVFKKNQWPNETMRQVIWDALQDYGRIKWKRTLKFLEEARDLAYQDILKEFDSTWGSNTLL